MSRIDNSTDFITIPFPQSNVQLAKKDQDILKFVPYAQCWFKLKSDFYTEVNSQDQHTNINKFMYTQLRL